MIKIQIKAIGHKFSLHKNYLKRKKNKKKLGISIRGNMCSDANNGSPPLTLRLSFSCGALSRCPGHTRTLSPRGDCPTPTGPCTPTKSTSTCSSNKVSQMQAQGQSNASSRSVKCKPKVSQAQGHDTIL